MSTVLATKLYRPATPPRRVERLHLRARLDEGLASGRPVTLVSAPAGFGKTTCVSAWAGSLSLPVTWLSLDPSDDEPGRFLTYLVAALQKVCPDFGQEIEGIAQAGQMPPVDTISAMLINRVVECPDRFVLVMDDFQVIQDRAILQVMERIVDHLPPPMHLVLVTREDPALPLARLRANNQLTEVRAGDLRFSGDEAERFLNEVMALALSGPDIALLEDRTEGWVVGLQLAGFSIRDRADPSGFIAGLSGSHRHILSYLTEEVLSQQTEDIQQFLLQTSILGKLSGGLCNAVTGRIDSHDLLERLLSANLFLVSLDDEQQWYRYHHLFADLLANRLGQTLPSASIHELHRRASRWLAENDHPDEAIRHALAGEDFEGAASLVEQAAPGMMYGGRVEALKRWLALLPGPAFHDHPRLSVFRVWIGLLHGQSDPRTVQETEHMLAELPQSAENDRLRAEFMVVLCRFVAFAGDTTRAIALAEEALAHLGPDDLALRARAYSTLAIAYGIEGRIDQSEPASRECLRLALASGNYSLAAHTTMYTAVGQTIYGHLREAARLSQSIIDMGAQSGQAVFYPTGQGYVGLAGVHLEWNDLEAAENYVSQGINLCFQGGLDGVFAGSMIRAHLRQIKGDLEGALAELAPLEPFAQKIGDTTLPTRQIKIRLAMGDLEGAARYAAMLAAMLDAGSGRMPLLVAETIRIALAWAALAQGDLERTNQLLDNLEATAGAGGRNGRLIEAYLLRALALQKQVGGRITPEAAAYFEQALEIGEPEGYVRLFVDEGAAVIPLLDAAAHRQELPDRLREYARRLLEALPAQPGPSAQAPAGQNLLIEPLTAREMEVLQLIAAGDSNQDIADKLVVTLSAVKKHTGNIFDKLAVSSRTQAIARAREIGLIGDER